MRCGVREEPVELSMQYSSVRPGRMGLVPPHPCPLPQGEGTLHPALRRVEALWIGDNAAYGSPSPPGEGWGEGKETLRKPARLRTVDEVGYPEQRKTKLHARQSAESLTVSAAFPLTLALSPREREHCIPRCDESRRPGPAKTRRAILPLPKGGPGGFRSI